MITESITITCIYPFSADHMRVSMYVKLGLAIEKNQIQDKAAPTESANQEGSQALKST